MKISERKAVIENLFVQCLEILHSKGTDYSGEADALSNFKLNAERLGLTKYQVWLVYFSKHVDSVQNSIKKNPGKPQVESEPLEDRIKDIINYAALLYCLLQEDEESGSEERSAPFPESMGDGMISPKEFEELVERARYGDRACWPRSEFEDLTVYFPPPRSH